MKDGSYDLNWDVLIQPQQTIAIYMGVAGLRILCSELTKRGMDEKTPAAIIQQGTTPNQRVFTGTLKTLPDIVDSHEIKPPSMVIIGEVVKLHEKLAWYEPVTN